LDAQEVLERLPITRGTSIRLFILRLFVTLQTRRANLTGILFYFERNYSNVQPFNFRHSS
jgi:hypothetical protein